MKSFWTEQDVRDVEKCSLGCWSGCWWDALDGRFNTPKTKKSSIQKKTTWHARHTATNEIHSSKTSSKPSVNTETLCSTPTAQPLVCRCLRCKKKEKHKKKTQTHHRSKIKNKKTNTKLKTKELTSRRAFGPNLTLVLGCRGMCCDVVGCSVGSEETPAILKPLRSKTFFEFKEGG